MGMCLDDVGEIGIEVRRESFIVHAGYAYDGDLRHAEGSLAESWRHNPHPEFLLADLDDLIEALKQAKAYVERDRGVEIDLGNGVIKRVRK